MPTTRLLKMMINRGLKIVGGGIALAAMIAVVSWAVEPKVAEVNLSRDICASFAHDRLDVDNVVGQLELTSSEKPDWDEAKKEYLNEIKRLIAEHNARHEGPRYRFGTGVPAQMTSKPYRVLAAGVICNNSDLKTCRNRNFWFFKKFPPKQLAQIVFDGTVKKDIDIKKCPFPRWAGGAKRPLDPDQEAILNRVARDMPNDFRDGFVKAVHDRLRLVPGHLTRDDVREAIAEALKEQRRAQ